MIETRERIINAALELFSTKSYEAVKTKEIAKAADVNESTIFKYFSGKKELFQDVITENIQVLDAESLCHGGMTGDLETDLILIGKQIYHIYEANAKIIKITMKSVIDEDGVLSKFVPIARGGHIQSHIVRYLEMVIDDGRITGNAEHICNYYLSCVNGYLMNCFVFEQEKAEIDYLEWMIHRVFQSIV